MLFATYLERNMKQIYISRSFGTLLLLFSMSILFSCEKQDAVTIAEQVQDTIYGPLVNFHAPTPIPDQYILTFDESQLQIPFSRSGQQLEEMDETVARHANQILKDNHISSEALSKVFKGKETKAWL